MSKLLHIDDSNFETEVLQSELPVVVDFSATWCGPCQRLKPIVEEIAEDYDGRVRVAHVDIDQAQDTAAKYSVMSVPTLKFIKSGEIVDEAFGLMSKSDLSARIDQLIG